MPDNPLIYITLYQSKSWKLLGRPQTWRWRAVSGGNFRVLAKSSESYTNRADCVAAISQLFGTSSNVYLREAEHGDTELRLAIWYLGD